MKSAWSLYLLVLVFMFFSCTKKEGEGGTASISGKVKVQLVSDNFQNDYASFYIAKKDVYIIYGDDEYYSDKTETSYDGSYYFGYLRKGNYRVFTYSDDSTGTSESGKVALIQDIAINKNGRKVVLDDMLVYDQVTNFEGSSTIKGKLFAYDYNSNLTTIKDSFYLRNEYVYISRKLDYYYFDRIKTYYDGSFVFTSVPQGEYEVYAYSRDIDGLDPQDEVPIIIDVRIDKHLQTKDVGRLDIIN